MKTFVNIAETINKSGDLNKALLFLSNPAAWKKCIEEAKDLIYSRPKYDHESRFTISDLNKIQIVFENFIAKNFANDKVKNLIIDIVNNIMQPLACLSPVALKDYVRILYKVQKERIIDEHKELMTYVNDRKLYTTFYIFPRNDITSFITFERGKAIGMDVKGVILEVYKELFRTSDGFKFYENYIQNDTEDNKKGYSEDLKSTILSTLESYYDIKKYNEFYHICYGALPSSQALESLPLLISDSLADQTTTSSTLASNISNLIQIHTHKNKIKIYCNFNNLKVCLNNAYYYKLLIDILYRIQETVVSFIYSM